MLSRRGNALILILGIALVLGIQIYIVQTFTMGSFRHVEKVNGHIRAIYVGESAFSQVVARLKAATWENRWFKSGPTRDTSIALAGGSYSDLVEDVPGATDKLVDVWIEAHYDTAVSLMYYRVLYQDDTLDFTAQVFPTFFSFLDAGQPNPFTGTLPPSIALVQGMIGQQQANQAAAIAALNGVKGTCDLNGAMAALSITPPGTPLDSGTLLTGTGIDLCSYVNGVNAALAAAPPPPPAMPLPPPLSTGAHITDVIRNAFLSFDPTAVFPTTANDKVSSHANLTQYFAANVDNPWKMAAVNHEDPPIANQPYGHNLQDHVQQFMLPMLNQMDTYNLALDPRGANLKFVADSVIGFLENALKNANGGALPAAILSLPPAIDQPTYMVLYNALVRAPTGVYAFPGTGMKH